jgi:crotonobetainyl-CoA:carnitine CoA-transferase CaiB-like acyl-CoA transferase
MAEPKKNTGAALDDLRVLDLADEKGVYCGKVLAGLGAEVIKIEKPGGDAMRDNGPFYHDIPHRERSLYWWHFNTNKKSITLNLDTSDGREIFQRLVKTADVLVETYEPGYLDGLGLGYEALSKINPGLIMTSITHFGQRGPYRDYKGSDIVDLAMGGFMYPCGHPDTPPLMAFAEQGYHTASNYGAIAALFALYNRDVTGKGEYIDIPIQTCAAFSLECANIWYIYWGLVLPRRGTRHGGNPPGSDLGHISPASDGWVCTFPGIMPIDWMVADGMAEFLNTQEWLIKIFTRMTPEEEKSLVRVKDNWSKTHTKAELFEGCQNMHVPWMPISTLEDVCNDPQLKERGFFEPVAHPELGETFTYPGAAIKMHGTPWLSQKRAPLIGEHNLEIYEKEIGFSKKDLALLAAGGVI